VRKAAIPGLLALAAISAAALGSCSIGTGSVTGAVVGTLNVPDCWSGPYNLQPDFYAAVPYMTTLELRIQKGGDYETFSDGVAILIDDTTKIIPNEYGEALTVSLPAGVTPVGVPLAANPNPSIVHMSLYLQQTCRIQDVALYALDSVTLNPHGNCDSADGGQPIIVCPGSESGLVDGGRAPSSDAGADDAGADAGAADASAGDAGAQPIGHSTITFTSLFDGNENAVSASERLNQGTFSVYLADPREMCPGGVGPPPPCRGYLTGNFSFEFQLGRPAEPFP
jgi:hypothetical protein